MSNVTVHQIGDDLRLSIRRSVNADTPLVFAPGVHRFATKAKSIVAQLLPGTSISAMPGASIELTGDGGFLMGVDAERISISNLRIKYLDWSGKASNFQTPIELRGCREVDIRDCVFDQVGGIGIKLCTRSASDADGRKFDVLGDSVRRTSDVVVMDCIFRNMSGAAIGTKPGGCSDVDVVRCHVKGFGSYGMIFEGDAGNGPLGLVSHIRVADCAIEDGDPEKYYGPGNDSIYGIYTGEDAFNIKIDRVAIDKLTAKNRCVGLCVSTSPSQGDRPVSGVKMRGSIVRAAMPVLVWAGKAPITGIDVEHPSNLFYRAPHVAKNVTEWPQST
jgi:hypothetical protein